MVSFSERKDRVGRPRIRDQKKELILELYWYDGLSLREVANSLGLSHMTVWRIIKETGIPRDLKVML